VTPGKNKNENALPYQSIMSGLPNRHFHAGAVVCLWFGTGLFYARHIKNYFSKSIFLTEILLPDIIW
jgi:hypothetical protein